jgi:hypothetical protein
VIGYKKKDGNVWYGYYYGPDGKQRCVCTKQVDRAAARAFLREREREVHGAPGSMRAKGETGHTVRDALQHFLEFGCMDVAPATKGMYQHQSGHLVRLLDNIDVGKLTLALHSLITTENTARLDSARSLAELRVTATRTFRRQWRVRRTHPCLRPHTRWS